MTNKTICQLTLFLYPQKEGGVTITCKELPELITEADSIEEIHHNVIDAFNAISEAYVGLGWSLPSEIYCSRETPIR